MTLTPRSVLAPTIRTYLTLKRALGRQYASEERVLAHLDRFLVGRRADLTADSFAAWCLTLQHRASGCRRACMRTVRNLCLYRHRHEPDCFIPDVRLFPPEHQAIRPHFFTEGEVTRLLAAARRRTRTDNSPLCPENLRLAVVLLYTTGLRRRELTRLTLGDYDPRAQTLMIRASKFTNRACSPSRPERPVKPTTWWKLGAMRDSRSTPRARCSGIAAPRPAGIAAEAWVTPCGNCFNKPGSERRLATSQVAWA